jgi:hypothetical protein
MISLITSLKSEFALTIKIDIGLPDNGNIWPTITNLSGCDLKNNLLGDIKSRSRG